MPLLGLDGLDRVAISGGLAQQVFDLGQLRLKLTDLALDLGGLAIGELLLGRTVAPAWLVRGPARRGSLRASLLGGDGHVLLTNPGLLARYQALGLLDDLRERTTRHPESGQTLRTLWVLVPAEDPDALPAISGQAIPVTTAAERLVLPDVWIDNVHHTTVPTGVLAP